MLALELVRQLAERRMAVVFELADEQVDLAELIGHRDQLLVDQPLLGVELGGGAEALLFEEDAVGLDELSDDRVGIGGGWRVHSGPTMPRPLRRQQQRADPASEHAAADQAQNECNHHGGDPNDRV